MIIATATILSIQAREYRENALISGNATGDAADGAHRNYRHSADVAVSLKPKF